MSVNFTPSSAFSTPVNIMSNSANTEKDRDKGPDVSAQPEIQSVPVSQTSPIDNGKDRDKEPKVSVELISQSIQLSQVTSQKGSAQQKPNFQQLKEIQTNSYRQFLRLHYPKLLEKEIEQEVSNLEVEANFKWDTQRNLGDYLLKELASIPDKSKMPVYSVMCDKSAEMLEQFEYLLDGLNDVKFSFKEWEKVLRNYVNVDVAILDELKKIKFSCQQLENNLERDFGIPIDVLKALSEIEFSHKELEIILKKDIGCLERGNEVKCSLKKWEKVLKRDLGIEIDILDVLTKTKTSLKGWGEILKTDILDVLSETKFSHKKLTKILKKYVGLSDGLSDVKFSHEKLEEFLREEIDFLNTLMDGMKLTQEMEEGDFQQIRRNCRALLLKLTEGNISASKAIELLSPMVQKLEVKIKSMRSFSRMVEQNVHLFQDIFQNCVKIDQGEFEGITFTSLNRESSCKHKDVISSLVMRQFYEAWENINDSHLRYYSKFIAQAVRLKETVMSHIDSLENLENIPK